MTTAKRFKVVTNPANPLEQRVLPKAGYVVGLRRTDKGFVRRFFRIDQVSKLGDKYDVIMGSDGNFLKGTA